MEAKRLKAPEDQDAKLIELLAEAMLGNAMLQVTAKENILIPAVEREAVAHLVEQHQASKRRACEVIAG